MTIKERKIKPSTFLKIAYLIVLCTILLYVKSVLDVDSFKAKIKEAEKPSVEVKSAAITLKVELPEGVKKFAAVRKNTDSVLDFLSELRDKQELFYEIDLYVYGIEVVNVNNIEASSSNRWAVYLEDKDITNKLGDIYLEDGKTYILKQTIRSEEQ